LGEGNTRYRKITLKLNQEKDLEIIEFIDSIPVSLRGHMIKTAIKEFMSRYKEIIEGTGSQPFDFNDSSSNKFKDVF